MTADRAHWMRAWAALTIAFALHVLDEATHNFLGVYNPTALSIHARTGQDIFPPVFTFPVWLAGLCVAVLVLAAMTPLLRTPRRGMIIAAYIYSAIHTLNGLLHLTISLIRGTIMPGAISSPLLLLTAGWLFVETSRVRHES